MKKLFFLICACVILSVPVFADNSLYFANPTVTITTQDNSYTYTYTSLSSSSPVYFYRKYNSNNSQYTLFAISEFQNAQYSYSLNGGSANTYSITSAFGDYFNKQVTGDSISVSYSPDITVFPYSTSDSEIQSAFADFLANQNPVLGSPTSFTLPAGNVLYFKVDSAQSVTLDANMNHLSNVIFTSAYGPWGNSGIEFGPAASLPTSGTTFPILSTSGVRWFVKAPTNVLGQSKIGTHSFDCISGQYYCLYAPSVFGLGNTSADLDSNSSRPGANVFVQGSFSEIKVYPLSSSFDFSDGQFVTTSTDGFDSYFDGLVDGDGNVIFENQDGVVSNPTFGGSNYEDYDTDPVSLIEGIKATLNNILSEIKSLFTFGYEAIQSLVEIMSGFVNVLSGLYTWLPDPVYSALISAVIVAIVIGVFKVFL